ncbi:hypothetical protein ABKJ22_01725 [Mesomycoplasma hyopneumoniae]
MPKINKNSEIKIIDKKLIVWIFSINLDFHKDIFKYPYELRQAIYTTNSIGSVNKLIRKNTKTKGGIQSGNYRLKITKLV